MAALAMHVSVRDETGQTRSFGPGEVVPDWAARQITNPKAWEDGEVPFPSDSDSKPASPAAPSSQPGDQGASDLSAKVDALDAKIDAVAEVLVVVKEVLDVLAEQLSGITLVEDGDADEEVPIPPKAGKGSGEDKWRAYAAAQGVDVTDIEDRNDIIAALKDAGVPVE